MLFSLLSAETQLCPIIPHYKQLEMSRRKLALPSFLMGKKNKKGTPQVPGKQKTDKIRKEHMVETNAGMSP